MNFMAVSSSSLGLALHFNPKRGGTKTQQTVIWAMKLALFSINSFQESNNPVGGVGCAIPYAPLGGYTAAAVRLDGVLRKPFVEFRPHDPIRLSSGEHGDMPPAHFEVFLVLAGHCVHQALGRQGWHDVVLRSSHYQQRLADAAQVDAPPADGECVFEQLIVMIQLSDELLEKAPWHTDEIIGPVTHGFVNRDVLLTIHVKPEARESRNIVGGAEHFKAGGHQARGHTAEALDHKINWKGVPA